MTFWPPQSLFAAGIQALAEQPEVAYADLIERRGWRSICQNFAQNVGISVEHMRVLDAFASQEEPGSAAVVEQGSPEGIFAALEALLHRHEAALMTLVVQRLQQEVDAPQAAMFGRRLEAVCSLLLYEPAESTQADVAVGDKGQPPQGGAGLVGPIKRLWRVGLLCRVDEILCAARPKALRIRAICDFYYSHAAVLFHLFQRFPEVSSRDNAGVMSLEHAVATASWEPCGERAQHALLAPMTDLGPIHVNVLQVTGPTLRMFDCRGAGGPQPITEVAEAMGAWAATSGGFFLYTEKDIAPPSRRTDPVGLFVREGEVLWPPVFQRAALCQTDTGALWLGPIGMQGVTMAWEEPAPGQLRVEAMARLDAVAGGPVCWNRAHPRPDEHSFMGMSFVGQEAVEVGVGLRDVPLAGGLVLVPSGTALPTRGAALRFALPPTPQGLITEGIAGGPMLLSSLFPTLELAAEDFAGDAPPVTFSQDETFDQNLLPRMAAGLRADGTLILAAIDGRNFHLAPGFTLGHTARLMRALGCVSAMNLDGGSSKRMLIHGRVVDLPSTEVQASPGPHAHSGDGLSMKPRIRPVHTAILLL